MAQAPSSPDELVELAAVVRAHGLRGELVLKPFNPESDLLARVARVVLKLREGGSRAYTVEGARGHSDQVLLALEGVRDRDQADALRGALVCVARADFPEPEDDQYYLVDLVGLEARDASGRVWGRVEQVLQYPSVCCLLISGEEGSWEVPDTERYVPAIAVDGGFVTVDHLDELDVLRVSPAKDRG